MSLQEQIGPYRILRKIGSGGVGVVYEAVHEAIERRVAIKVLHDDYARDTAFSSRLFNEARAVSRIEHPGLVQISDYGRTPEGRVYLVMELLKGESLAGRQARFPQGMPVGEALRLSWQLADCLSTAHARGIIHRDIKPDNVMIVADRAAENGERTKLLDFGIAKLTDPSTAVTSATLIMGSPRYMSPEQCRGGVPIDAKSDVYSLGVVLYSLLAGRVPFVSESQTEVMSQHMFDQPPPLRSLAPKVPEPVAELVHRMLQKNKEQRPNMGLAASELESLLVLAPPSPRRQSTSDLPVEKPPPPSPPPPAVAVERTAQIPSSRTPTSASAAAAMVNEVKTQRLRLWISIGLVIVGVLLLVLLAILLRQPAGTESSQAADLGPNLTQKGPAATGNKGPSTPDPAALKEPATPGKKKSGSGKGKSKKGSSKRSGKTPAGEGT